MKWMVSIALSLFLFFTLGFLVAEQAGWMDDGSVRAWMAKVHERPGGTVLVAGVIAGLLTADLLIPVPSSVLMLLAGTWLGWLGGWLVTLAGAMGSALIGFGVCRRWGKGAFVRLVGDLDEARLTRFFERHGVWAILLSRSVPMVTEVVSCMAGLSGMRTRLFVIVTLAGTAPLCGVYAWAGARAVEGEALGWAVALAFVVPAIGTMVYRLVLQPARR
jgi:uncharacterized membrane protein YdjX (TVP38/TMEM64 family)